jgi:peptide/nickel transport system substrate-binding protein
MRIRSAATAMTALLISLTLAGCGGGGGAASANNGVLDIGMPNGPITDDNNPFLSSSPGTSLGYDYLIYEPLVMSNAVQPTAPGRPWLATKWTWSNDYTTLNLTIRDNVTWSDGQPLTAADVAYTFQLVKQHSALNGYSIPFGDITANGNQVTLTFPSSQFVNQDKILDTLVVPKHQWSTMKDPTTDAVTNPIGTGPYTLKSFTPQTVTLQERSTYWQAQPSVRQINYTSYTSNDAQTTALATGASDWSFVYIPNVKALYTSKDPAHHQLWVPETLAVHGLWFNTQQAPFNDPVLRQAASMVVNRQDIHTQGEGAFYPEVDNPTGLPLPAGSSFLAPAYRGQNVAVDVAGAKKLLTDAGYRYSGNTLLDHSGKPVTLALTDPAGWSDYMADLQIIQDNLSSIGIGATINRADQNAWNTAVDTGDFQATVHWTNAGATPYDLYQTVMDGSLYKPIGTGGTEGDWGRFTDDAATNALSQYANATDPATRTTALNTVEQIMAQQVPMIPLFAVTDGAEYSTAHWVGWPDAQNPYAGLQPNKSGAIDVVLHLRPAN